MDGRVRLDDAYSLHTVAGGCSAGLLLMLHPQVIGGPRIAMLDRFVAYCLGCPGVRIATCGTPAAEFRAAGGGRPIQGGRLPVG